MRVLMFGWEFPPHQAGGLATATVGLVKGLLRVGVEVTLVVPFPVSESPIAGLRLVGAEESPALRVHRIPSPLDPYGTVQGYADGLRSERGRSGADRSPYGGDLMAEVERFTSLAAEIAEREPHDVIDAHDWITFQAGVRARARSGRPLVAHIHAIEFDRTGSDGNPLIAGRERDGLAAADRVIANSHRLKRLCVDRYGVVADKVDVIHWGIDGSPGAEVAERAPAPFGPGTPIALFLGRVTSQKGPDLFLEMAARVARLVPTAHFVMAGTGDLLGGLIERAAELGLADRVHFTGGLGGADVARAFRMADVCVMPSRSEPFGLVALESLLHGTPCVVAREAGVAEVVRNAIKVDCWDLDEMTNQVASILRHRPLRDELADRGRREVGLPRFALDEPARLTAATYRAATARRSNPGALA